MILGALRLAAAQWHCQAHPPGPGRADPGDNGQLSDLLLKSSSATRSAELVATVLRTAPNDRLTADIPHFWPILSWGQKKVIFTQNRSPVHAQQARPPQFDINIQSHPQSNQIESMMTSNPLLAAALMSTALGFAGAFSLTCTPQLRGFPMGGVSAAGPMSLARHRLVQTSRSVPLRRKRQQPVKMVHDPSWFADNMLLFAQEIADGVSDLGEKMEDMLQDIDAIPGNDLTEVLEEADGKLGQGSVRNAIVTFMFKNPLFKALLGTQAGWGLVLVFSLIMIGQAFEMLKENISKNLPERLLFP